MKGKEYYLFTEKCRKCTTDYFKDGIPVAKLGDFSKAYGIPVKKTLTKLPIYIKYVEKEMGIVVYNKIHNKKKKFKKDATNLMVA